jgi:transposase
MFSAKKKASQPEFWINADQVVMPAKCSFYSKLEETLESFGFADKVRELCAPAYNNSGNGRPGIDPAVYLKMMMVGFFEDLPSERAIAARCADSIAIRQFIHYELTEATPDHSSLSIIRQRLEGPIYDQVFTLVLSALQEHGLLRGKNLGIDSSVMEANASLRGLVNRNTGEAYWDYVKRLAAESGINPQDSAAVRKFDRKRPKKMSNDEWENPDEPEAKIGPKKDGATDMIYRPELVADLDRGAIVGAEVLPGNQSDHQEVCPHILEAQATINAARDEQPEVLTVETATADKGYFEVTQVVALQQEQIKTVICDPIGNRRLDKLDEAGRPAVKAAHRSTRSKYGKDLLSRRGMHLERAFAHILDCGGMRRATVRGRQNLNKRFKLAAAFYNLSQLMRKLFGMGTPRQCEAMGPSALGAFLKAIALWLLAIVVKLIGLESKEVRKTNCSTWPIRPLEMAA